MDRNVLLGYGFAVAGVISGVLNNFWLLREVAAEVSKSDLGTYVIVLAITTYASLAQFGVGAAASQDFAQALAAGQEARAARTYAQLSFFNRAIFASCSLLSVAVAGVIHAMADGGNSPLASVVLWTGLCIAVRFLFNASSAALQGAQAVHVVSVVQLVTNLLAVVLGYLFLRAGAGIVCLPLGQFGANIVGVILLGWQRHGRCPWAGGQKAVRAGFGDLLRFGAAVNLTVALTMVETSVEPAIFQLVSPDPLIDTASYHVWSRVPAMAQVLTVTLVATTAPALAARLQADPSAGLAFYRRLVWLALIIAACLVLGIGMWLASTVHVWMAGEYDTAQGTNLALCFALVAGARSLLFAVASAFYPLHRVRIVITAYLMQLVAKLLLGVALASMLGLTGMALAYALSVLLALVYLAAHACNLGLLRRQQLWVATAVTPLAAAVVYVLTPAIACRDLGCLIEGVLITGLLLGILVLAGLWQLSRKTREP